MRDGQKTALIGGVLALVVGATGFGAYALLADGEADDSTDGKQVASRSEPEKKQVKTGPPSAEEVRRAAQGFLDAWESGRSAKAAALTDDEEAARGALASFRKDARLSRLQLTEGTPAGTTVPFTVDATVTYQDGERKRTTPWRYHSKLTVVRDKVTGRAVVDWRPSVLHPQLEEGEKLRTGPSDAPPLKAVDRNGTELTAEAHPTLAGVLQDLAKRYGTKAGGSPGWAIQVVDAKGKKRQTLRPLSKGTPGTLRTTLDARLQQVAEQAVAGTKKGAVVAVKPSTGEILALANAPAKGFNTALQGAYAPGSTMKVVTASLLIDKGLAKPDAPHPCPKYFTYGGWKFHNDDKFEIKDGTFAQSFARSCNTAFISQAPELENDDLTKQARDVFGIGLDWKVGTTTFDGRVPVQSGAQMGASLIGQGGVRVNPLVMASVSATVQSGTFRQPYLVSPELDDRTLAKASRPLSPGTAQSLRDLMRLTATSGTAAKAMAGLGGDVGAKTGSAEVDGQKKPNAWFTAYRGDLAAAAVVPNSGHGGDFAGPVVRKVLEAGG